MPANSRNSEEIEVVSASHTSPSLIFLDMFTNYTISILAFNPAGEGPRSESVSVKTLQGIPGPPDRLRFSEITMNTLKVSWDPPQKPNGEIIGYIVAYETAQQDEGTIVVCRDEAKCLYLPVAMPIFASSSRLLQASETESHGALSLRAQSRGVGHLHILCAGADDRLRPLGSGKRDDWAPAGLPRTTQRSRPQQDNILREAFLDERQLGERTYFGLLHRITEKR